MSLAGKAVLAAQTQLRPAGGQHLQSRTAHQQVGHHWRARQQVLKVIEHQQEALIGQGRRQALDHWQLARFANPKRVRDGGRDVASVGLDLGPG